MKIDIRGDFKKMQAMATRSEREVLVPATATAINKAMRKGDTATRREVAKHLKIKQRILRDRTRLTKATWAKLAAELRVKTEDIGWTSIGIRHRRRGIAAGGNRYHKHAFVALSRRGRHNKGGKRQVFVRRTGHGDYDGRYPLRMLRQGLRAPYKVTFSKHEKQIRVWFQEEHDREMLRRLKNLDRKLNA